MKKTEDQGPGELDALQPEGNFRDDPLTPEELEALRRSEGLAEARAANRQGPSHPAHEFHQQWLDERNLGPEWDNLTTA